MEQTFGRAIKDARRASGLSQRDLAERVGIDFTYLSKIENDRMDPPSERVIVALADALATDADELIRLAGKVPTDLAEFLVADPIAIRYLRSSQGDIQTREDWIDHLRRKGRL
jgi:transcriptional regulator with XRE-family HTH domain